MFLKRSFYRIITAKSLSELQKLVNDKLENGWELVLYTPSYSTYHYDYDRRYDYVREIVFNCDDQETYHIMKDILNNEEV